LGLFPDSVSLHPGYVKYEISGVGAVGWAARPNIFLIINLLLGFVALSPT
jgi:hypothetical protein